MSEARKGWGGEFHLSTDDDPANYDEMVEVVSFGLPDDQSDEIEVTHLKSPNKRKEFISGLTDGGEVEVSLNYIPGSATDLATPGVYSPVHAKIGTPVQAFTP